MTGGPVSQEIQRAEVLGVEGGLVVAVTGEKGEAGRS